MFNIMEPTFNVRQESEIYIGPTSDILSGVLPEGRVVVVSDATIDRLYHSMLAPYDTVLIGLGESIKTLQTVESIYRRFIELGVDRSTFVLAIGGGIVTDVAGFAASTYMRGIGFGFVSTTLLGQVDASVGGKNGVNVDGYKNMAGTFTQPKFVICDPEMLRTLSDREFRAGLAEVVKAAIIADADLFSRIEATTFDDLRSNTDLLTDAVSASIRVKADIVERDERESGDRRKLNLGHTLAHAIEKCTNRLNHGEAVAVGMALIADASVKLGVLTAGDRDRIVNVLKNLGFDLTLPVDVKRLLKEVDKDKKNEDGMLRIVVPVGIGDCDVRRMSHDEFAALFA
jgi:3-dehydroquinate synthase